MQQKLLKYPGLATLADLYFDRLVYGTLIIASLSAGMRIWMG